MKKIPVKVVAFLLMGSLLSSSCIGSFSLFNKYAKWQCNMTNSKFVNAIVGFILMPIVGSVCLLVDSVVLNTIEFWGGSNPVQANVGKTQQVLGSDGVLYAVKTLENGYEVTAPSGEVSYFIYDKEQDTWSLQQNGVTRELFRWNQDGTITTVLPDGQLMTVAADESGVDQVKAAVNEGRYFAMQ